MSVFGSLFTAVAGLNAQSQSLSMISDNIANSQTIGYKSNSAQFSDLVTSASANSQYSSGGVLTHTVQNIDTQGLLQQTQSSTDLAISGSGFFVVQPTTTVGQGVAYTRAGSFQPDSSGYMVNTNGFYLLGWPLSATGQLPGGTDVISSLQPVNLNSVASTLAPTTTASFNMNLNANHAVGDTYSRSLTVYDTLGAQQSVQLDFTKTGANAWNLVVSGGGASTTQAITFNTDGSIATPNPATIAFAGANWGNGSAVQNINLDVTNLTQEAASDNVTSTTQDGLPYGTRDGVTVDKNGYVIANYTNGLSRKIYQLPIATFTADTQLQSQSGDTYAETLGSGSYYLHQPGTGAAGAISPSSLEQSNVDLGAEFSNMIVTQRAYSANTHVITTADQMLQDLLQVQ